MQTQKTNKARNGSNSSISMPAELETIPAIGHLQRATVYLERGDVGQEHALLHMMEEIQALACPLNPDIQVYGRIKSTVSTSQKMLDKFLDAHEILDVIGIRAITRHTRDCYRLIRGIHSAFPVLPREYDDYIATPKRNGYRSIHTTVVSPSGLPVEIQVRTQTMHETCERGSAAHSVYKRNRVAWFPLFPSPPHRLRSALAF